MMTGRTSTVLDQVDAARVSDAMAHPPFTRPRRAFVASRPLARASVQACG